MAQGRSGHRQPLRDPRADELRRRFHALYASGEIPVPVEAIAEDLLGLSVEDEELPVSGMLLPAERRIWLNAREARDSPGRRRFTLAHELGHWVCQCLEGRGVPVMCRPQDVSANTDRALEREANVFAAELIMPEAAVRAQFDKASSIEACAVSFAVSPPAIQWRLYNLDLISEVPQPGGGSR